MLNKIWVYICISFSFIVLVFTYKRGKQDKENEYIKKKYLNKLSYDNNKNHISSSSELSDKLQNGTF